MGQYEKKIINALLDSYENSRAFRGEGKINRSPQFVFSKKNMPEYFSESSTEYIAVNESAKHLEKCGYISIVWKNREIIDKVLLNTETVDDVYLYSGRNSKRQLNDKALEILQKHEKVCDTPVCSRLIAYLAERLENNMSVKEYFDLECGNSLEDLLKAVYEIEKNSRSCYIREFSIRIFHDSKKFERIKGRVIKAFRNFGVECIGDEEKEILASYNIYNTPDYVYIKGNANIQLNTETLFLGNLKQGLGISGDDIGNIKVQPVPEVRKIITIENLTTFFRWEDDGALLIYLGGYHNTARRKLLAGIYQVFPGADYYHFGDIDAGGIEIYRDLKKKTGIPFAPYKMDIEALRKYSQYGKSLTVNDRNHLNRLSKAIANDMYHEELSDLIGYMLTENLKLEQECILPENFTNRIKSVDIISHPK